MLLLRDEVIRAAMESAEVIDGLERMLARPVEGALELPARLTIDATRARGFLRLMPVVAYDTGYCGYKAMNFHPEYGVRYMIAMIALSDGELVALLDADWITAYRTAATAAIAVRHLARQGSETVTVLGSGTQARALLEATAEVMRPRQVIVHSPTAENRERFAAEMSDRLGLAVEAVAEPRTALESADVVLSAFRADATPVIHADAIRNGTLVCAISSVRPQHREVDMSLWGSARVVVDDLVHVRESGDGLAATELGLTRDEDVAELWQVLRDPSRGRRSDEERVLFKSVGTAEQDIALAALVIDRARSLGVGDNLDGFPSLRPIQSRLVAPSPESCGLTMPSPLRFTFAISSYDHVQAVVDGRIPIEGVEPLFVQLPIPEMFRRFVAHRDWDVSEMSFVQYGTIRASGDDSIVGIPAFPSRMYRHTAIFVRSDRVRTPEDLIGKRIGIVAWANSAAVWARGLLADMHGIQASDVTWYQGGVERPGRPEVVRPQFLSPDVQVVPVADRGIEEMLWTGDLDAIIVPAPPASVETSANSGGLIRRLYDNPAEAEGAYRERTGCLPIMHVVAMTRALVERDPSIVTRVYDALERARREYFERAADPASGLVPIPWLGDHVAAVRPLLGGEVWPYGVEPNRPTLGTYQRYLRAQGLVGGDVDPAELFPEWSAAYAGVTP